MQRLSVKNDPGGTDFSTIVYEFGKLDTVFICDAISAIESKGSSAIHFQIRLNYLKATIGGFRGCPEYHNWLSLAKSALEKAYQIEDSDLIIVGNNCMASGYRMDKEPGLSVMHTRIALEEREKRGIKYYNLFSRDYYVLGEMLYHSRQYEASVEASRKSIEFNNNPTVKIVPLTTGNKMFLFNNLGLAYLKLSKYDSAFIAFNESQKFARELGLKEWVGLIDGNKGDVFFKLAQYDSAAYYLSKDLATSLNAGKLWRDNAANSLQWLARINAYKGNTQQALNQLNEANKLLKGLPDPLTQANIYYGFMETFERMGKTDSMSFYLQKYLTIHDSIEQKAAEARAEIVEMRLDNQAGIHQIESLNKEKKRVALIRNFSVALALLITALSLVYSNRKRLKMQLQQQQMQEEKDRARAEAEAAREQLNIFTDQIIKKNMLLESLGEKLSEKELTEHQIQQISVLTHHTILTDEDWERFKQLFEKIYPGFFHSLKKKAIDITVAEQRIAALSKLHISSKEASNLLGISPASVNKTRQRLRARLGLDAEVDLEHFFSQFSPSPF